MPQPARAGFFDFLFNGFQQQQRLPSPSVNSYAEPGTPPRFAPDIQHHSGISRGIAYCVRLCDGQHFPLQHIPNATMVETCRTMCPASKTKVFFGSAIDRASARDGQRYADLDTAYVYRDHLVSNCTCNGKDAFGLAPIEVNGDPTLRPGDVVSTKDGFMAFAGRRGGGTAEFTPVDASALSTAAKSSRVQVGRRSIESEVVEEEPGVVVPQGDPQANAQTGLRRQVER